MYSTDNVCTSTEEDLFKASFKKYKSRRNDLDLTDVVDFHQFRENERSCPDKVSATSSSENLKQESSASNACTKVKTLNYLPHLSSSEHNHIENALRLGLKPVSEWDVYEHSNIPGMVYIADPFIDDNAKNQWTELCLKQYHRKPNICNLDMHSERNSDLWTDFLTDMKRGLKVSETSFYKLRWVTLGYHYDWNTKKYYKGIVSEFPPKLHQLSSYLARCLGYSYYNAEAGIVNYYHLDSTLAGHTDHSEYDMSSPLFSISFGCDAIFLIGGETKAVKPIAIYLRSGDIVVMAGKSRLAYHAIPKIIGPCAIQSEAGGLDTEDFELKCVSEYMKQSRININIRQVLKQGEEFPSY